jgi:hypothetical protein
VRATALFRELSAGAAGATQLMEKVDRFLDPACVTEATVLSVWREKYENEITVRTKRRWWRRLGKTGVKDPSLCRGASFSPPRL